MENFTKCMQKVNYGMFWVLMASLPFPRVAMQWCWIIWAVTWLLEFRFLNPKNLQWGKPMIPALFLFGWVVWECVSLIWAKNQVVGGRFPDPHVSLLFFPLIALYGLNDLYDWKKIAKVFVIACVSSFFLYSWLLYWVHNFVYVLWDPHSAKLPLDLTLFDTVFSNIKHRMLYCSALGVAIILLFFLRKDLVKEWGKWPGYVFFLGSLAVLVTAILATGSRANLLTLLALGAVAIVLQIKRYRALVATTMVALVVAGSLAIWKFHPRMKNLTIDQITNIEEHYHDPHMQPRVIIWHLALEQPGDYVAKGLGAGNAKGYLAEKFARVDLPLYIEEEYGPHNQYLQVCMELGFVAMLLFILCWYGMPFCFPKGSPARKFALFFVLFFGINLFTDDNMSRIEGVIYTCSFLLMMSLMAKQAPDKQAITD